MSKIIVHIDLNAFFVRCEEIRDPSLEGKCVAIGHEGRAGIVSTCSYEARKFGVHSGQAMFQAKQCCPHLIIKEVDWSYYSMMSKNFINFVRKYTDLVEQASVDECFADFTLALKGNKDPIEFFRKFQKDLYRKTKLFCSIGVAPTKFLAKMGSDYKKPNGLTIIRRKDLETILYPIPIKDMFGVGKKTLPRLETIGIKTIGDMKERMDRDDPQLMSLMGKFYSEAKLWVNGYGSDKVYVDEWDPKSIGRSSTFLHDTDDLDEIKDMFNRLSKEVSESAVKERKVGQTIQIVIKTTEFKSFNKSRTLNAPTNDAKIIYETAVELYTTNFKNNLVRLVGVTLQNLIDPRDVSIQMTLFDYEKHEEENQTKLIINSLNRKLKKPLLMRASEIEKKK